MQMVRLLKDGEPYRMSKRTGRSVTLKDLLELVPVDAARFFFNLTSPRTALDFDLDLAAKQSSENPVYYVQYAHARICSILRKLAEKGIVPRQPKPEELLLLGAPDEIELIRLLARLPEQIVGAAQSLDPARLTRYVLDVATQFHKFYTNHHVAGENESLTQARLCLCAATKTVLANTLGLLKISAPESM
jgi:arginyl-tRNA synthetase